MPSPSYQNTCLAARGETIKSARDEVGILPNLVWHCLFVLDPESETRPAGTFQLRPVIREAPREGNTPARESLHAEALQSVMKLLNPLAGRHLRGPFASAAKGYDFGCRLRAEVTRLQARHDPRAIALQEHVRAILEESLIRWPSAFSRYCGEIMGAESDLAHLLVLLGRAASHTETLDEFRGIEQAQQKVTEWMRARMASPAGLTESKASVASSGGMEDSEAIPAQMRPASRSHFTRKQSQILEHCVELGSLFFRHRSQAPGLIKPRLFPLICAPTGGGKSMLVATVAQHLNLRYLRMQRGDLAPQGASRVRSTVFTVLDTLVAHERVLLHLDELDKFTTESGAPTPTSEWGAGIFSDIWSLLDGVLPLASYLAAPDRVSLPGVNLTAEFLEKRIRTGLWVVGSGTWQSIFSRARKPPMGFGGAADPAGTDVCADDIAAAGIISPELLMRFNSDLQMFGYPDRDEINALLEATGMAALARRCGYTVTESDLDFGRGGFRVIESLYSRLLLLEAKMLGGSEPRSALSSTAPISSLLSPNLSHP